MPFFITTPFVVEARRVSVDNLEELETWSHGSIKGTRLDRSQRCIDIQTFNGEERANIGDWIVSTQKGNFAVFPDHVFSTKFIPVEDSTCATIDSLRTAQVRIAEDMVCAYLESKGLSRERKEYRKKEGVE